MLLKYGDVLIMIHSCNIVLKASAYSSVIAHGCDTDVREVKRAKDPVINTLKTKAKK